MDVRTSTRGRGAYYRIEVDISGPTSTLEHLYAEAHRFVAELIDTGVVPWDMVSVVRFRPRGMGAHVVHVLASAHTVSASAAMKREIDEMIPKFFSGR